MNKITIKNARLHNLKGIDVSIPKGKLTVVTGVSGSGKSTIVFDILFEEGRRQYLQSLGILTRLEDQDKFDKITGLAPTVAVQQNIIRQSNPRSTVGTRTNLLAMLSILYSGEGYMMCPSCGSQVADNLVCPQCGYQAERLPPTYFSCNSPNGMCMTCSGRGAYYEIDMDKLVPNEDTTLQEVFDAIQTTPGYLRLLQRHFTNYLNLPFQEIPDEIKQDIIHGHHITNNYTNRSISLHRIFEARVYRFGTDFTGLYNQIVCPSCNGTRVGEDARRVFLNDCHIGQLGQITINELYEFIESLPGQPEFSPLSNNLISDIKKKMLSLINNRLGYLTLYREMPTLSGGEIQRLFLNSHLESGLDSLIYILDEPTTGLHESEKAELIQSITKLNQTGNTVIVVEHDHSTIKNAEYVLDIGPEAGIQGGEIVYQGDFEGLLVCDQSLTGAYLSGRMKIPERKSAVKDIVEDDISWIRVHSAKTNNLKNLDVSFPLGMLVGVAGVSGSGKSSLISDTLVPLAKEHFSSRSGKRRNISNKAPEEAAISTVDPIVEKIEGLEFISGIIEITQAPIGRNKSSNPATYIGIWDNVRKLFASQPDAVQLGLSAGHFSFNSDGACQECGGTGNEKIWLGNNFFIERTCEKCHGKRYNDQTLAVKYKDKTITDILNMRVEEAVPFFEEQKSIIRVLEVMNRIGMGYIQLGQPTPTLSGGEAQRIKLAKAIGKRQRGNILYVMDEPTTGLSMHDTVKLIQMLDKLVMKGHSVIIIEHDPTILSICDWLIELGPNGGKDGGELIAQGPPQAIRNNARSKTGKYLR